MPTNPTPTMVKLPDNPAAPSAAAASIILILFFSFFILLFVTAIARSHGRSLLQIQKIPALDHAHDLDLLHFRVSEAILHLPPSLSIGPWCFSGSLSFSL
jgi:hypothetical protein